ncbi:MAG: hypothetical protein QOK03_1220 [Candidatus Binataceae bacterium]|nr:hypothetical protein [Candidatus Binataceae bacterium]
MATEIIKDRLGNIIGRISDDGRVRTARDQLGNVLGRYDKAADRTRDRLGNTITSGGDVTGGLILNRKKPR